MKKHIPNAITCCNLICGCIATCFAFSAGDKVLVFSFSLADQEPYTSLYKLMAASIQTAE